MVEGLQQIVNSKSKTFLAFCFCFIAGAGGASLFDWPYGLAFYIYISLFLISCFIVIFWHNHFARFIITCFLFLIIGVWRFTLTIPNCSDEKTLCYFNGRTVTFTGWVSEEPDRRIDQARYTVSALKASVGAENFLPLHTVSGRILVTTQRYPEYRYGDTLEIKCKLRMPENLDDTTFRYDKYVERMGVWSVCGFPVIQKQNVGAENFLPLRAVFNFKNKVQERLSTLWHEPDASFMAGILYGSKSGLPKTVSDNFNKTGVTHIIAVSGYNVTIIVVALMAVLIRIGFWRQQAFWIVTLSIIVFVIFTGATSSVVRAGVMGLLVLVAQQLGRLSRIANVLIFTAAVMLLQNPYVLVWDAGFQLSFLATLGLVYVSPILLAIERKGVWQYAPTAVWETFIQTLSAIIATLPLILFQFGRLSIVAPLVNVLVLWVVPWLMLGGFVSIVVSYVFFPFGQLLAWLVDAGLKYVLFVVEFFGNQRWSAVEWHMPFPLMIILYSALIVYVQRKNKTLRLRGGL